jgi:hypothetical protein
MYALVGTRCLLSNVHIITCTDWVTTVTNVLIAIRCGPSAVRNLCDRSVIRFSGRFRFWTSCRGKNKRFELNIYVALTYLSFNWHYVDSSLQAHLFLGYVWFRKHQQTSVKHSVVNSKTVTAITLLAVVIFWCLKCHSSCSRWTRVGPHRWYSSTGLCARSRYIWV